MKKTNYTIFTLILFLILTRNLLSEEIPEMVTDRPDQSESANIVVPGWLQVETGFTLGMDDMDGLETTNLGLATTLFRFGVFEAMELRFGFAYSKITSKYNDMENDISGLSDTELGFKVKITEGDDLIPEIAVLVSTALPHGEEALVPEYAEPGFRFSFEKGLNETLSTCANLGMAWEGGIPSYIYSCALGIGLTDKLGAFVELYGDAASDFKPNHQFDCGFTYSLMDNLQFDIAGGYALSEITEDMFVGAGLAFRLPK